MSRPKRQTRIMIEREKAGYSIADMTKALGIAESTYLSYENSGYLPNKHCRVMASMFECSTAFLAGKISERFIHNQYTHAVEYTADKAIEQFEQNDVIPNKLEVNLMNKRQLVIIVLLLAERMSLQHYRAFISAMLVDYETHREP